LNTWGYHLLVDASGCDYDAITDEDVIADFARTLVDEIDMKAYGDPAVVYFGDHDEKVAGFTLTQMIETSLISAHFADAAKSAYIDIFSCKEFNAEDALDHIVKYFSPEEIRYLFVDRGAGLENERNPVWNSY
jgi:S-adenosylmethionine/arginine decarboxylase-like enzyme